MNDQMILDNYLLILKSSVEVYVHGTLESSTEDIRKLLNNCLNDILDMQNDTYNVMTDCGWYVTEDVSVSQIKNTYNKVKCD